MISTPRRAPSQIVYTIQHTPRGRVYSARMGDVKPYGCQSWPACVAGGTLCPDPNGFGASLNPCCSRVPPDGPCPDDVPQAPNTDGSYGLVGSATDVISNAATQSVSAIPTWVWLAGLGVLGGAVFIGVRR
jgi:hypothetical protein